MNISKFVTPFSAAITISVIYGLTLLVSHGELNELPGDIASRTNLNLLGDSVGGLTAPLALIWLIAAVIMQRQELNLTKTELAKTAEAMNDQVAIAWTSADANWKLSLFEKRMSIYLELKAISQSTKFMRLVDKEFIERLSNIAESMKFVFNNDVQDWIQKIIDAASTANEFDWKHRALLEDVKAGNIAKNTADLERNYKNQILVSQTRLAVLIQWSNVQRELDRHLILPDKIDVNAYEKVSKDQQGNNKSPTKITLKRTEI